MQNRSVGVFDSGIGGLTVLREFLSKFSRGYNIHYVGDTARAPYGSKPASQVVSYARGILEFLMDRKVESIICACNTSDSLLANSDKLSLGVPYFSVVQAFSDMVDKRLESGTSLAIIATENTVRSGSLLKTVVASEKVDRVMQQACRLFVPIIEKGIWDGRLADSIIRHHLSPVRQFDPDLLVMGCTHYPFLERGISEYLGRAVGIIDPGRLVVESFAEKTRSEVPERTTKISFYVSGSAQDFRERLFQAGFAESFPCSIDQTSFPPVAGKKDLAG